MKKNSLPEARISNSRAVGTIVDAYTEVGVTALTSVISEAPKSSAR